MRKTYYEKMYYWCDWLKKCLLPSILLLMITCVSAGGIVIAGEMQKVIKGIVKDSNGTPLAGVTVAVGNSNNTTTTDDNGAFMLDRVNEGDMLILTSVGFKRAQVTVDRKSTRLNSS